MKNRFCEMLGIKYPIVQGGMAWSSDATLAAAVSEAGGAGIIGTGGRSTEWVKEEIVKAKSLTDKPFGVNLMLMAPNVEEIADVICEEKVAFVTTGAGSPMPWIERMHKSGVKIIPVVPNVKLAQRIGKSGADAMIIEGMEAGGHLGTQTTMAVLSNVMQYDYSIPVLAAGGISDGRAMAAAILMGADGVQMGSRFLLTEECPIPDNVKEFICNATDTDSVVTGFSRGHSVRCLRNVFTDEFLKEEVAGMPTDDLLKLAIGRSRKGMAEGDLANGSIMVGESLNVLNEVASCHDVIEKVVQEFHETMNKAAELNGSF